MAWQPTPFTAPLLVAAVASFALSLYALGNRSRGDVRLVRSLVGVAAGSGIWSLAYAAQLSATTLDWTLLWNRFVWLGIGILAVAWPAFVLSYVDRTAWLRPRRLVFLCLVPAATVAGTLLFGRPRCSISPPRSSPPTGIWSWRTSRRRRCSASSRTRFS